MSSRAALMHLKRAATALVARPVVWRGLRPVRRHRLAVLTYHRVIAGRTLFRGVEAGEFRRQIEWLARHCDVIAPHELMSQASHRRRRPAVLITFDDGYRDYHEIAYPILRRLGIPSVNFLPTRVIDTGEPFWWDLVEYAVHASRHRRIVEPWSNHECSLDTEGRRGLVRRAKEALKKHARPHEAPLLQELLARLELEARPAALP